MECAYCGRKKRMFESFTRYSFCPDCNAEVRSRITRGLELIRTACALCDARMGDTGCPLTDSELLWRIGDALETIDDLEDLRPLAPFFKSGTGEYRDTLSLCKRALASGSRPVVIRPAMSQRERERAEFLKRLDSLESDPVVSETARRPAPRRKPDPVRRIMLSRVTGVSRSQALADFVALDLATTGINPARHEITEISAIRFRSFSPVRRFYTPVLPATPIPAAIERLGGVTNELVRGAPLLHEVLPALERFLGEDHLVGYGLLSDLQFLYACGLDVEVGKRRFYDTKVIAQSFLSAPERRRGTAEDIPSCDVENYRLDTLCLRYSIPFEEAHHPAAPCLANGCLFGAMVHERTNQKEEVCV